jgi:hypothetical protein
MRGILFMSPLKIKVTNESLQFVISYFRETFLKKGLRKCWQNNPLEAECNLIIALLLGHPKAKEILKELRSIKTELKKK